MMTACVYFASIPTGESGELSCAIKSLKASFGLVNGSFTVLSPHLILRYLDRLVLFAPVLGPPVPPGLAGSG